MSLARHWRLQTQRYRLMGVVCEDCGAKLLPRRLVCPHCKSHSLLSHQFNGEGTVYSHTAVYDAPSGYEGYVPYLAALVQLDEGQEGQPSWYASSQTTTRSAAKAVIIKPRPNIKQ